MDQKDLFLPNVIRVGEIVRYNDEEDILPQEFKTKYGKDTKWYHFLVWTTGDGIHRFESDLIDKIRERRRNIITDVNQYYLKPLDI